MKLKKTGVQNFIVTGKTVLLLFVCAILNETVATPPSVDNPYEGIKWNEIHYLHSFTHQHGRPLSTPEAWHGRGEERLNGLYDQGLRHFPLSNYVPSVPVYPFFPLTDRLEQKDDVIAAPNAEHRTPTDFNMHFTTPGSYYSSGFVHTWQVDTQEAPYTHEFDEDEIPFFDGLTVYDPDGGLESDGAYRLNISLSAREGSDAQPGARISFEGIVEREGRTTIRPADGGGKVEDLQIQSSYAEYALFLDQEPKVHIDYDPATTKIDYVRLTARTLIPWREAFSKALDGDRINEQGQRVEGLQFEDGGGVIINHPGRSDFEEYLPLLDFDDRVLGMEIWNQRRAFGMESSPPHDRYFNHWDNVLRTGRQMYGFAVKDHRWLGRGRSVLVVPEPEERTREERKRDALRAYRQGQFFAVIGAIDTDEEGNPLPTRDHTNFRFRLIELEKNDQGDPIAVRAQVDGNEEIRPNVQLRFITNWGMEKVVNDSEARFELPRDEDGTITRKYVRIEAMAFPDTHNQGEALTADMIENMNVYDIALLHDYRGTAGGFDDFERGNEPLGIVDMVFAQPIRFVHEFQEPVPERPESLKTPQNNATEVSMTPRFSWNQAPGAVTYELQLATDSEFEEVIATASDLRETEYNLPEELDGESNFYWRVRGKNDAGPGEWSETWSFTTQAQVLPDMVKLLTPTDNSKEVEITPLFIWEEAERAKWYDLWVYDSIYFQTYVHKKDIQHTEYQINEELGNDVTYFWRVRSGNTYGNSSWSEAFSFTTASTTDAQQKNLPDKFILKQNYPNPFNSSTIIRFAIPRETHINLVIYDMLGQKVANLINESLSPGWHDSTFVATGLSSGLFLYRITTDSHDETRQMMLMK